MSDMSINPSSILSVAWCHDLAEIDNWAPDDMWQGWWGRRTPSMIEPLSVGWIFNGWSHLWGHSGGAPTFNFSDETQHSEVLDRNGWFAAAGTLDYQARILSPRPFEFVGYGGAAISLQRQHIPGPHPHWVVQHELYVRTGDHFQRNGTILDAELQPHFDLDMGTMSCATMPTYDWVTKSVLVPFIAQEDYPEPVWSALAAMQEVTSKEAGVFTGERAAQVGIDCDVFDLGDMVRGMGVSDRNDPAYQDDTPRRSEN